MGEPKMISFRA